jgi:O-antigen/teichoic acid export membrane protein
MVAYPLYLSFLSFEHYGIWLALSSILTLAQLGTLGIAPAITKYVSEELSRGAHEAARSYAVSALVIGLVSATVVAATIGLVRGELVTFLKISQESRELAVGLAIPIAILSAQTLIAQVPFGLLVAIGRSDQLSFVQTAGRLLAFVLTWVMLAQGVGVASLLWGLFIAQVLVQVACEVLVWRQQRICMWQFAKLSPGRLRTMLHFGLGIFGTSICQLFSQPLNRAMLSRYGNVALLPHFEVAHAAAMQLRALLGTTSQSLLPEYSKAVATNDLARVKHLNAKSTRFILLCAIPLYLPLLVFAPLVLQLWLRARYSPQQTPCFRVTLVGSFIILLAAPAYHYLLAVGRVRSVFLSQLLQTAGTFLLLCLGVAWFGRLTPLSMAVCVSSGYIMTAVWLIGHARFSLRHSMRRIPPDGQSS